MTVTGKTLVENLAKVPPLSKDQDIIRPLNDPLKGTGHLQIMKGNLASKGAVGKLQVKKEHDSRGRHAFSKMNMIQIQAYRRGK